MRAHRINLFPHVVLHSMTKRALRFRPGFFNAVPSFFKLLSWNLQRTLFIGCGEKKMFRFFKGKVRKSKYKPIGPKFCVGHHVTPGNWIMNDQNFKKLCLKVFYFVKFRKSTIFFIKSAKFFFYVLKCTQREHVHNLNRRWARSAQKA